MVWLELSWYGQRRHGWCGAGGSSLIQAFERIIYVAAEEAMLAVVPCATGAEASLTATVMIVETRGSD
eukprot:3173206-Pleurochrysis_carterae.AAC.6